MPQVEQSPAAPDPDVPATQPRRRRRNAKLPLPDVLIAEWTDLERLAGAREALDRMAHAHHVTPQGVRGALKRAGIQIHVEKGISEDVLLAAEKDYLNAGVSAYVAAMQHGIPHGVFQDFMKTRGTIRSQGVSIHLTKKRRRERRG